MDIRAINEKFRSPSKGINLPKRDTPSVAIYITAGQATLLDLIKTDSGLCVNGIAFRRLFKDAIVDNEIKDIDKIGEVIGSMRTEAQVQSKQAVIAVPGATTTIKQIKMNAALTGAEREAQVWIEACSHFPDLIDDLSLDFVPLGTNPNDNAYIDVLLVACRKTNIQARVDALARGGFTAKVVDVDYYALGRAVSLIADQLPNQGYGKTVALLNIGLLTSTFIVLHDHELIYFREQNLSIKRLLQKIQELLGVEDVLFDLASKKASLSDAAKVETMTLMQNALVPHVRQFVQLFNSAEQYGIVQYLVLSGICAVIPGLAPVVESQVGVGTCIAHPFVKMKTGPNVDINLLQHIAPTFMICCGLAMHGLNYDRC